MSVTPSPTPDATRLLTAEDLAERWSVPKTHPLRLAREGKLPCVRLGKYVRFRVEDIVTFERDGGTE